MSRWLPLALLVTQPALASGGSPSGDGVDPQAFVVVLLLVVGVAYLLSHFLVDMLQKRFLFVSGFEYILLGVGLGYLPIFEDLTALGPVLALAAGWVGLVYGMELDLRKLLELGDSEMRGLGGGAGRIALFEGLGSGVAVAVAAHFFFELGLVPGVTRSWLAAGAMGCAGAAGSASAIHLVTSRYKVDSPLVHLLRRAAGLGDLASILVFGWLFCAFHESSTLGGYDTSTSLWAWITVGLGLSMGILFSVFLGDDESDNSRFLAMVGIIAFASGAAFFLDLSLLAVNLILGMWVTNSLQDGAGVRATLSNTRRPMSLVLLFFAGALWSPPWRADGFALATVWPVVLLTVAYIFSRMIGKYVGCWIGAMGTRLRPDLGRGLLAQGDEALAMALSLKLVFSGPEIDLAYTAILGSVMVHELVAPRLLKNLLVDAGDIRTERTAMDEPERDAMPELEE